VGENRYLLNRVVVKTNDKSIATSDLKRNVKQKPNMKILGFWKFHLGLFNLAGKDKSKGFNKWLRRIGEEPVLYEDFQTKRSSSQLKIYLQQKGYFNAEVRDSVAFKKKKARVYYFVDAKEPYRYHSIYRGLNELPYNFLSPFQAESEMPDSTEIRKFIIADKENSNVKSGDKVDSDVLANERIRISKSFKNQGYFNFSREYIHFLMDSTSKNKQMDVFVGVKTPEDSSAIKKYRINQISIFTEYDTKLMLLNDENYLNALDTMQYEGFNFIYKDKIKIKPDVILSSILIRKGEFYNLKSVEQTYSRLQSLNQFKFVNVKFEVDPNSVNKPVADLNCIIQLSPYDLQSYSVELEGTNSWGNIGFAGNLNYQHKNLFGGAEILDLQLSIAKETYYSSDETDFNSTEYGIESKLSIAKFLLPLFSAEKFRKSYNPNTVFSLSYNYQERPDYTRTILDASFGYEWKSTKYISHSFNLMELYFVDVKNVSDDFLSEISSLYIQNSFTDHVIPASSYSLVYNDQNINKAGAYNYFKFNLETAGNTLNGLNKLLGRSKNITYDDDGEVDETYYDFFGIRYAQYVKADFEYRYNQYINKANKMVYRILAGAGVPYGNYGVLPFEKSYVSGGASGIRAWQIGSLGPGSFVTDEDVDYPYNYADLKLEANLEYRFKLFWVLEGALFVDAGNIWALSSDDEREGACFKLNRFYKEIALGTGFGTRVDLSFILFRIDLGLKLRDPSADVEKSWVIAHRPFKLSQLNFNIGIGYPF
jgi:outer membrane protein assembly factor BamA